MPTFEPVRWRFSDGPPDVDVIYFAAPRARASDKPHDLDTKASRSYCSLLFPTNPLFIYKGKHLRAEGPWRGGEVLFSSWQPLCLSAGISRIDAGSCCGFRRHMPAARALAVG